MRAAIPDGGQNADDGYDIGFGGGRGDGCHFYDWGWRGDCGCIFNNLRRGAPSQRRNNQAKADCQNRRFRLHLFLRFYLDSISVTG